MRTLAPAVSQRWPFRTHDKDRPSNCKYLSFKMQRMLLATQKGGFAPGARRHRTCYFHATSEALTVLAVLTVFFFSAICLGAAPKTQGGLNNPTVVPETRINRHTVRITLSEGNDIQFARLSVSAGLSQTRVDQIVQDEQGFMWFGTQYGLNRYDGYKFKVFTPDPGNDNSLSGAYIYSLFKDRSGILWIGCDEFLDRFDPKTENFTHIHLEAEDTQVPVAVVDISQDRGGTLWLSTGRGLYGLDPLTMRITHHYVHNEKDRLSIGSNAVTSTGEDREGRFWVGAGDHLEQVDRRTGEVKLRVSLGVSALNRFSFHEDRSGAFWISYIAGDGGGLALLDPNANVLTRYTFYDTKSNKTERIGIHTTLEDRSGTFWLATMGAGLVKFDPQHQTARRYSNDPADLKSIGDNRVVALEEDREGNIWAGLHAREPNFFLSTPVSFTSPLPKSFNPDNLGESLVNAIYEDYRGILWVGAAGVLIRIDRSTGKNISYRPPNLGFNDQIVDIVGDRSGVIWFGTFGQGLYRFNPRTARFTTFRHHAADSLSLSDNAIIRVFIDHSGGMWLATWNGLDRFDPLTGTFEVHKHDRESRTEYYYKIAEDKRGFLWLSGNTGLQRFDPATGKFTAYQHRLGDPSSISDNRVSSVYIDSTDTVWAATNYGLNKLDRSTGIFTRYFTRDGLPSNFISCILGDQHDNLWMSTNQGLSEFDPVAKTFENYSVADGLPGSDLTGWGACFKSRTGEMFFGGFSGATAFYPNKVVNESYVPPIYFTDFRLLGHSVAPGADSPLKASISYTNDLRLFSRQNSFSLEFAALDYANQSMSRYRYKLAGLSSRWTEVDGSQRSVTYSGLAAGDYTFNVQAGVGKGGWSAPGAIMHIRVLPPWWATWWFETICLSLIALTMLATYSYRMRQIHLQFDLRLEERVGERTRIARELHDTLLQSFQALILRFQTVCNLLPARPVEARQRLEGSIAEAVQAITEGRGAVQGLRLPSTLNGDLALAVGALGKALAVDETNQNPPPEFRVEVEGAPRELHPILRDDVYRIAGEALRNAFRHAEARRIEVEVRYDEHQLRLRVRDDGKGFDSLKLLGARRDGHWGLTGMRERAKLVGGKLEVWSDLRSGTEIELSVPASSAYVGPGSRLRSWFHRRVAKAKS